MSYYNHYYKRYYRGSYQQRCPRYYHYNDHLLYELMKRRDRYRDLYYNELYNIDRCNPYYAEIAGCRY